jgi:Transposase DDE domain/Transposase DNA-binding
MVELINSFPDFSGRFGDKRIEKRAAEALQKLTMGRTSSLRQITQSNAEQKSFYRLFNNESFSEDGIEKSIVDRCADFCEGRHLLLIQDTTEFNLSSHRGRVKPQSGLGRTAKDDVLGFMLHSCLSVDAGSTNALGFSYIKGWARQQDMPDRHQRDYKRLSIENKESHKWIAAARQSKELLHKARMLTIIADREADIYELLAMADAETLHVLVRSAWNRKLLDGSTLTQHLNRLPVMHEYSLMLNGDVRKGIEKRMAHMVLKWCRVPVRRSKNTVNKDLPLSKDLYVVEACERNKSKGIYWRLLTTHPVNNSEQAMQIIEWYKQRWHIEQVHRLLKTEGFRLERSHLESGWAIRKLTLLAMMATLRIVQMMLAYEDDHEQPIDEVFDGEQQKCLTMMNRQLEGETDKLKNPAAPRTLKWATWIIARLGGWKGYRSQRKPGPIVLQKGLAKFYHIYEGWLVHQNFLKDVGTQ